MNYYVYLHRKKTNGEVFYVGKGKNNRIKVHANRSDFWEKIVSKHGYTTEIVLDNIQEWYAFELEKELIALYGRRDENKGSLVNLTDGGEGSSGILKTKEQRIATSKRMKGMNHPRADHKIYELVQLSTKEIYRGTLSYFREAFKLPLNPLIKGECKSLNGWSLKEVFDTIDLDILLHPQAGMRHNLVDTSIYSFTNLITNEVVEMTRYDFMKSYNLNVQCMFSTRVSHIVDNWCLTVNKDIALMSSKFNYKVYKFRKEDEVFEGTRYQFKQKYGIDVGKLLVKTKTAKHVHGWRLC